MRLTRLALAALLLLVSGAAAAQQGVLLLEAPQGCDFRQWREALEARGVVLRHAFPPAGGLVVPEDVESALPVEALVPKDTQLFAFSPSGEHALRLQATQEGRLLWHAQRALMGLEGDRLPESPVPGSPLEHDALAPEDTGGARVACSSSGLLKTNSEYMLGSVTLTIILPESTGMGTEDWTQTEETSVVNEITEGCNDLTTYYNATGHPASQRPTWTYTLVSGRTDARAQVGVEPIAGNGPTSSSLLWVDTIYDALGYSAYSGLDQGRTYNGDKKAADGTDWAYTVFVADSSVDSDGKYLDGRFGYAYLGGPFEIMTYDNDGWGISSMNKVHRHESSHIFYGLDEYSGACACTDSSGYINYVDSNCTATGCPSNVDCIMKEAARQQNVCSFTAGMIGWGDTDADHVPDPVDIEPTTALTAYSPDPTTNSALTYTGSAAIATLTNQNIYNYRCDINVLRIANVQWRVDGGAWQSATPSDGTFNGLTENYTFTTGALAPGSHTVETRAVDDVGQTDSTLASDTVTVQAGNPPGTPNGSGGKSPLRGTRSDTAGTTLAVTWDTSCSPTASNLIWGYGAGLPTAYTGTYTPSGSACGIGAGSYSWTAVPDPASDPRRFLWFLVVASNGAGTEGSWGRNTSQERTGPGTGGASNRCSCTAKSLANTCGQ